MDVVEKYFEADSDLLSLIEDLNEDIDVCQIVERHFCKDCHWFIYDDKIYYNYDGLCLDDCLDELLCFDKNFVICKNDKYMFVIDYDVKGYVDEQSNCFIFLLENEIKDNNFIKMIVNNESTIEDDEEIY